MSEQLDYTTWKPVDRSNPGDRARWVLHLQGWGPGARAVLHAIVWHDGDIEPFPSLETLAKETGISTRAVIAHRKALAAAGALDIQRRRRDTVTYTVHYEVDPRTITPPGFDQDVKKSTVLNPDQDVKKSTLRCEETCNQDVKKPANPPLQSPYSEEPDKRTGREPGGRRARGAPDPQGGKKRPARKFEYPAAFDAMWDLYPTAGKVKKRAALKAWQKLTPAEREKIIPALKAQVAANHFAGRDGRQFVPHATTWINQGRWEDEVDHGSAGRTGSGTAPDSAPVEAAPSIDAATTKKLREEYAARNRTANLRNHIERLETMLPKMPEGDAKRKDAARLAEARAELEALEGAAILETA